jgi:hypothetical protein
MTPAALFVLLHAPKGPRRQAIANAMLMNQLAPLGLERSLALSAVSADQSARQQISREQRLRERTQTDTVDGVNELLQQFIIDPVKPINIAHDLLEAQPALHRKLQQLQRQSQTRTQAKVDDARNEGLAEGERRCANAMLDVLAAYIYQSRTDLTPLLNIDSVPDLRQQTATLLNTLDAQLAAMPNLPALLGSFVQLLGEQRGLPKRQWLTEDQVQEHSLLYDLLAQYNLLADVIGPYSHAED